MMYPPKIGIQECINVKPTCREVSATVAGGENALPPLAALAHFLRFKARQLCFDQRQLCVFMKKVFVYTIYGLRAT
jgi:hypothetical protein